VQVGDQTYPASGSGFHVVVLDRTTLKLIANSTVTTTGSLMSAITLGLNPSISVGHYIPPPMYVNDQRLVIIQSVGDGRLTGTAGSLLVPIDRLGGTSEYLLASITGAHRYALVGAATDLPWHGTTSIESSTAMAADRTATTPGEVPAGQAYAVLQRDRDGLYTPSAGDVTGPTNAALFQIMYQPETAWPMADDTTGLRYVADNIGLCDPGMPCMYANVRSAYTNHGESWPILYDKLNGLNCSGGQDVCGPNFPALKSDLLNEFQWVDTVRILIENLQKPYLQSGGSVNVAAIYSQIMSSLEAPKNGSTTLSWVSIMTGLISKAANVVPKDAPQSGLVMGLAGAVATLATQAMQQQNGAPADTLTAAASQLALQLTNQQEAYFEWTNTAQDILVSDYGKLSKVGISIIHGDPGWVWDSQAANVLITALDAGTRAAAYSALIPVAWGGYNLKPGYNLSGSNDVGSYVCEEIEGGAGSRNKPFAGALPQNQFHAVTGINSSGAETDQVWTFAKDLTGWDNTHVPKATLPGTSLTDDIYGPDSTNPSVGAFEYRASWWRSTFNPPGHTTCSQEEGFPYPPSPWSTAWQPPNIPPPLP
jgi:hypothetical protein